MFKQSVKCEVSKVLFEDSLHQWIGSCFQTLEILQLSLLNVTYVIVVQRVVKCLFSLFGEYLVRI